jgi:hypothetical protein
MSDTHEHETLKDVELQFKSDSGKAVIEGMTAVPFQALIGLALQRKVFPLFKKWGRAPVIVNSELLTSLASAPQESSENRASLILVSMLLGMMLGVGGFALVIVLLGYANVFLTSKDYLIIVGAIGAIAILGFLLMNTPKRKRGEKLVENVEKLSSFLSGK